jgi:hypothetical protein
MKRQLQRSKVYSRGKRKVSITRNKVSKFSLWKRVMSVVFKKEKPNSIEFKSLSNKKSFLSISNLFGSKKTQIHTRQKPSTPSYGKSSDKEKVKMRVIQPKKDYFIKEAIKEKISIKKDKPKIKLNFGHKNFESLGRNIKSFKITDIYKNINYWIKRWKMKGNFNQIIVKIFGSFCVLSIVYLCIFDTHFLIKSYTIQYAEGSFLDEKNSKELIDNIKSRRVFGMFPNNQLWFVNSSNLTLSAQEYDSNIEKIEVLSRQLPNKTILKVSTSPVLLTLKINNGESWRIAKNGDVLSSDTASINERVVTVDRPVIFDSQNVTFEDYPLAQNKAQLNRLYFITWLWEILEKEGVVINSTSIPSMQDSDVSLIDTKGNKFVFNSESVRKDLQSSRIHGVLNHPEYKKEVNDGIINYIDFRVPKRIFICYDNTFCASKKS